MWLERNNVLLETSDPRCLHCTHLESRGGVDLDDWTCGAFPDGIPDIFLFPDDMPHDEVEDIQECDFIYEPVIYQDDSHPPIDIIYDETGRLMELSEYRVIHKKPR